ncbi:MAG: helix-turn-helix domain-containing protein [Kiritimatiellae bacterium]|nr:helix-turn-helix domain-containing protein [Kiritimatiellia bacterium]
MKKLKLELKRQDRLILKELSRRGEHHAREMVRANMLLALDQGMADATIAQMLGVERTTLWRTRRAYRAGGLQRALYDMPRPGRPMKYKMREQSEIVALACSNPPEGRERWTLTLLTQAARWREGMAQLNRESVRLILKKTNVSLGLKRCGAQVELRRNTASGCMIFWNCKRRSNFA